jgi:hypothetical protein
MSETPTVYPIKIAGVQRALPRVTVQPGMQIAVLNILGDVQLVEAAAALWQLDWHHIATMYS